MFEIKKNFNFNYGVPLGPNKSTFIHYIYVINIKKKY